MKSSNDSIPAFGLNFSNTGLPVAFGFRTVVLVVRGLLGVGREVVLVALGLLGAGRDVVLGLLGAGRDVVLVVLGLLGAGLTGVEVILLRRCLLRFI